LNNFKKAHRKKSLATFPARDGNVANLFLQCSAKDVFHKVLYVFPAGSCDSFPHKDVDLHRAPGPLCQLAEVFTPEIVASSSLLVLSNFEYKIQQSALDLFVHSKINFFSFVQVTRKCLTKKESYTVKKS
jgi:hypothetical protein